MQSIGNDIIALKTIDVARTNTPQFYKKILAANEQELYHAKFEHIPFHYYVWLLWSIKESAYKCLQRHNNGLVFSPVNIVVKKLTGKLNKPKLPAKAAKLLVPSASYQFTGTVAYLSQTLYSRSYISGDYLIHSVVTDVEYYEGSISIGAKSIEPSDPESQSAAVRRMLADQLNSLYPGKEINIQKHPSGYPFVIVDDIDIPVSFSHHHNWVGFAVYTNPDSNSPRIY